jgi:hypothetical protein
VNEIVHGVYDLVRQIDGANEIYYESVSVF